MNYDQPLRSTYWVYQALKKALIKQTGISLIRIGDGETRTIAHNNFISMDEIPPWLKYAGVNLPDEIVKINLVQALREADIVGVPLENHYCFKPMMIKIMGKYRLNITNLCHNRVNYHLYHRGYLTELISEQKIILVGRKADIAREYFSQWAEVQATYNLPDLSHLDETYSQIAQNQDFNIALVAAGIPAVILCPRLAQLNKVALDLGHVIDSIVTPDKDLICLMTEWAENQAQGGKDNV